MDVRPAASGLRKGLRDLPANGKHFDVFKDFELHLTGTTSWHFSDFDAAVDAAYQVHLLCARLRV